MSASISVKFILSGAFAGQTVALGSMPYRFVKGELTLQGSAEELALHAKFLERNWSAFPEGHPALGGRNDERDLQEDSAGILRPAQSERGGADSDQSGAAHGDFAAPAPPGDARPEGDGNGHTAFLNERLSHALAQLDHAVDSHWTRDGRPAISAVESLYGATDVTRSDIEAAAPGLRRNINK